MSGIVLRFKRSLNIDFRCDLIFVIWIQVIFDGSNSGFITSSLSSDLTAFKIVSPQLFGDRLSFGYSLHIPFWILPRDRSGLCKTEVFIRLSNRTFMFDHAQAVPVGYGYVCVFG